MTQDQWKRGDGWREDLAELRGFICDHMSAGEAGKACGLLSALSRHANVMDRENDKMRELVTDMWPHVRHRASMCMSCELGDECARSNEPCLLYEPMERRMCELGIYVDAD